MTPPHDESDLRQQWLALNIALTYAPDFIYSFDLNGRFTYVNNALLALWQKPLGDAIGKNFLELGYPPALAERLQHQILQVINGNLSIRDQTPFTGPDGETRCYEYIFVPVPGDDGRAKAVVGTTRDVTAQQKAVAESLRSEERLAFALDAGGGIGTWDWDIPADRVYCNASFAKLFSVDSRRASDGVPIEEFTTVVHREDRVALDEAIQQSMRTGQEFAAEYRVVQPDKSIRWVSARGRCHRDGAGNPTHFPGVVFDTTERKASEGALIESERQFRTLAESIPHLAWMAHADGSIFWYNRRWYEFTGKTFDEVEGWRWQSVHDPNVLPEVMVRWRDAIALGKAFEMVFPLRKADGTFRSFLTRIEPLRDHEGRVVRWFGTNTDITERLFIEEELRKKNEELEEFAYVAGHDLREPLRMINIYTQLIRKHCDDNDEKLRKYTDSVHSGVSRMETLLNDLLTFSRTVYEDTLAIGTANLSQCLEEARISLKSRIEDTGASITCGTLPCVRGDDSQMSHVFQNILSNALKYRREGVRPVIDVSSLTDAGICTLSFKDNGIGFEPKYAEQVFGLFKRLHRTEYEGTGLGLAICKRIVERYGGRIWAEAEPGCGAVFHISLPVA